MRRTPRFRVAFWPVFACLLLVWVPGCGSNNKPDRTPTQQDAFAILRLVGDSDRVLAALTQDETFKRASTSDPLTVDERDRTFTILATLIDHDLAFLSYRELFLDVWKRVKNPKLQVFVLAIGTGAHAAQLRARLVLIKLIGNNGAIRAALNEGSPEHGVAAGHIDRFLIETSRPDTMMLLDVAVETLNERKHLIKPKGSLPKDMNKTWQAARIKRKYELAGKEPPQQVKDTLAGLDTEDTFAAMIPMFIAFSEEVGERFSGMSGKLLNETINTMIGNEVQGVLSPIVTDIALWLGDTRLRSSDSHLISAELLDSVLPDLQPGDVVLERRNWYLSNLGLPGFWPHAAVYIGSPAEMAAHFDKDAELKKTYPNGLTAYLKKTYPNAWTSYEDAHEDGPNRIIEAVSEGVIFASLHHSCLADYVAFLRPRVTMTQRAVAITQAFAHWGEPYDFDFDFQTFTTVVCSELVYWSYKLPSAHGIGITFDPLPEVMGRLTLPPNDIIEDFDTTFGKAEQQFDFVAFLDGNETTQTATLGTVDDLRASWKRTKWDLSQE